MNGMRKAVLVASAEQQIALVANFVVAVVTSRFMTPQEIGITVLGAAVIGLVTALREYTGPTFLVRHDDLGRDNLRGALTAVILGNACLMLTLAALSPLIGYLYADPRLTAYLKVVALGLMIEAFALPVVAVLRRDMQFDRAACIGLTGTAAMTVTTISLAAHGFSSMSFAWGLVAGTSASAIAGVIMCPRFWWFRPGLRHAQDLIKFGRFSGSTAVLKQMYDSLPYLILGHVLPLDQVAYYHRALMLSQLPGKLLLQGVDAMMQPVLFRQARLSRDLKEPFVRAIECVAGVYWPALLVLVVVSGPLVHVLYGPAWEPVVPVLRIMGIAALFGLIGKLDASLLMAAGGLREMLQRSLVVFPLCGIIIAGSAFFGLIPLAISNLVTYPLQLAISIHFIQRCINISWREIGSRLIDSAYVAILSAAGPLLAVLTLSTATMPFLVTSVAGVLALIGWLGAIRLTQHRLLTEFVRNDEAPIIGGLAPLSSGDNADRS